MNMCDCLQTEMDWHDNSNENMIKKVPNNNDKQHICGFMPLIYASSFIFHFFSLFASELVLRFVIRCEDVQQTPMLLKIQKMST